MQPVSPGRLPLLLSAVLAAVVALLYGQCLWFGVVYYDDVYYVWQNDLVRYGFRWAGVVAAFTTSYAGNWHPLTWLSHMLDCQLFGNHPGPHHAASVLLHGAVCVGLFLILLRLTSALWPAFAAALLFTLHPMHVESVAWIAERKDVLCAVFWLAAIAAYARYARLLCLRRYGLVALFTLLALMSKPMAVTLPCSLLLLDVWPLGRLPLTRGVPVRERLRAGLRLVAEKIPLLALSAAMCWVTVIAQDADESINRRADLTAIMCGFDALANYGMYLIKAALPLNLSVLTPRYVDLPDLALAGMAAGLLLVTYAVTRALATRPWYAVGWFWYLGTLVPVAGFVPIGFQSYCDRYFYVPSIGICIMVAWGARDTLAWLEKRGGRQDLTRLAVGSGVTVAVVLAVLCFWQVQTWRNGIALFTNTVLTYPRHAPGHVFLGLVYSEAGRLEEALEHNRISLTLDPRAPVFVNTGTLLVRMGREAEAVEVYRQALAYDPQNGHAHYNLGLVHYRRHDYRAALASLEKARSALPRFPRIPYQMAWIYASAAEPTLRDPQKSLKLAQEACTLSGNENPNCLDVLAMALAATGDYEGALRTATQAAQLAQRAGDQALEREIAARRDLFRQGKPFVDL